MVEALTPVLETARFCLTPLAETDRRDFYAHLADPAMELLAAGQGIRWAIGDAAGLRRIEALVTPPNTPSAALLERFRFSREATLRDYAFWEGHFWDQWLYARLAGD